MKIWHPFTQEKTAQIPIKIVKGFQEYVFDEEGKKYIDMISNWWVNILGHSNQEIASVIYDQAKKLEHIIFAGFTHDPAENLCCQLSKFLPHELSNFFFSDNGSTAVEIAIKMAYQYFLNVGISNRNMYINLEGGYHGDTLGAMSAAGKNSKYHSTFSDFFFETFSIDFPEDIIELEEKSLEKLRKFLKKKGNKVCALIVEPLIQGAAGMRIYRPDFLKKIVEEVRQYGILVIFDEVMTGFYRTGTMFALDQCKVIPDIVCLSKGITGGFLPLALTITNNKVYESFLSDDWKKTFIHGHSYTANPIACAASCKTLEILQRIEVQRNIKAISRIHSVYLEKINGVFKKRQIGTIAAFNVKTHGQAKYIANKLFNYGIIIRPIDEKIYLMPPYCISEENLTFVYNKILDVLM